MKAQNCKVKINENYNFSAILIKWIFNLHCAFKFYSRQRDIRMYWQTGEGETGRRGL